MPELNKIVSNIKKQNNAPNDCSSRFKILKLLKGIFFDAKTFSVAGHEDIRTFSIGFEDIDDEEIKFLIFITLLSKTLKKV